MGDSLAVEKDDVWRLAEPAEGRQQRRPLPEAEEPGDVGEGDAGRKGRFLDDGQVGMAHQDDRRVEKIASPVIGDIGPGDSPDGIG